MLLQQCVAPSKEKFDTVEHWVRDPQAILAQGGARNSLSRGAMRSGVGPALLTRGGASRK